MNTFDGVSYALHTNDYGDTFSVDFRKSEDMDDFEVYIVRLGVNDVNEYNMRPTDAARDIATPQGIRPDSTRKDLEAAYGYIPKPKCSHNAPPVCGYFYEGDTAKLGFYICAEHSPGIRSIRLTVK